MAYLSKYHVREQHAPALLGPMSRTLRELEARTRHYLARVELEAGEDEHLRAANTITQLGFQPADDAEDYAAELDALQASEQASRT